jgi:uncharacterized protein (TIGR02145 family)
MSKNIILLTLLAALIQPSLAQRPSLELTFTAIDNAYHIDLESIKVINKTRDCDTTLFWPDTVLNMYYVGLHENSTDMNLFGVSQNYPNPVKDQTFITITIPAPDIVSIRATDQEGRVLLESSQWMEKGVHLYRFTPAGSGLCLFTAYWREHSGTIKILQPGTGSENGVDLEYIGSTGFTQENKLKSEMEGFSFEPGDRLVYVGFANGLQSGIIDYPESNETYTFQFATNIPCPGAPTVTYEGQVYNTIQVFSQCWMKENLNVGTMIQGDADMIDNEIIEKYCYGNIAENCDTFGGLYQWNEMMQYDTLEGRQGICPPGWHIATDEDWKILEGAVDGYYGIGDQEWDNTYLRGDEAGRRLKSPLEWTGHNGTDMFGFSGLPGGCRYGSSFGTYHDFGYWWTGHKDIYGYYLRFIHWSNFQIARMTDDDLDFHGYSVRCVKE